VAHEQSGIPRAGPGLQVATSHDAHWMRHTAPDGFLASQRSTAVLALDSRSRGDVGGSLCPHPPHTNAALVQIKIDSSASGLRAMRLSGAPE
jgi:hypothetical protein